MLLPSDIVMMMENAYKMFISIVFPALVPQCQTFVRLHLINQQLDLSSQPPDHALKGLCITSLVETIQVSLVNTGGSLLF